MFRFEELNQVHLEITSKCQASCPMCARNQHGGEVNPNLVINEIDLIFFKTIFSKVLLNQISNLYFCGNFGDPILSKDLIKMVEYCVEINPKLRIGIHTNGSARSTDWWKQLAKALPENHAVHFALDGLKDTHSLYRIGTDFEKILENAKAFIANGGKAEWVFLSFKHNEHQIAEAKKLAKDMGFFRFNHKATGRFVNDHTFPVQDKSGNFLYNLEPPKENNIVFIDKDKIKNFKTYVDSARIDCMVLKDKSIYIDSQGHLYPCCYLGSANYLFTTRNDVTFEYHEDQKNTVRDFINFLGGWQAINLKYKSVQDILKSHQWQSAWDIYWHTKKLTTCSRICGKWDEKIITQYNDQFIKSENFNDK